MKRIISVKRIVLAIAIAAFGINPIVNADATGDTYSFGLTAWDANTAGGAFIVAPTTLVFGSGPHTVGPSLLGNAGDTMVVTETVTAIDANTTMYIMEFSALDSGGARTNLIADGALASTGLPYQISFVDMADGNGGSDKLNPEFIPTFFPGNPWVVDAAEFYFIGTGGSLFGPGGLPFTFNQNNDSSGIGGFGGVNFGSDISTATFSGEEFAGWQVRYTVTAIPEPAMFGAIAIFGVVGLIRRRK